MQAEVILFTVNTKYKKEVKTVSPIVFSKHDYQSELDQLRIRFGFDFAGLALPTEDHVGMKIMWRYVSGNLNNRYQRIVLRNGRGIAGTVMKTGKPMTIANTDRDEIQQSLFNFPILLSEQLTALIAIPLWHNHRVKGVLLFGQRNGKSLPNETHDAIKVEGIGALTSEDKVIL